MYRLNLLLHEPELPGFLLELDELELLDLPGLSRRQRSQPYLMDRESRRPLVKTHHRQQADWDIPCDFGDDRAPGTISALPRYIYWPTASNATVLLIHTL
jgi:hypothetical protein